MWFKAKISPENCIIGMTYYVVIRIPKYTMAKEKKKNIKSTKSGYVFENYFLCKVDSENMFH